MASRRRVAWAGLAGALFAAGYTASQKLLYVAALAGLLAAGQQFLSGDFVLRREARRTALVVTAAVAVWFGYRALVTLLFVQSTRTTSIGAGLDVFAFYRGTLGMRVYSGMLPTLVPHIIVGLGLVAATVAALVGRRDHRRELVLAWAVVGLGAAVGLFHAGAFPYFWMTIGLFPATAAAIAWPAMASLLDTDRARKLALGGLGLILLLPSTTAAVALLEDSQAVQRESLAFVGRNFQPADRGFHPEGALFCRSDPEPLPVFFTQTIIGRFDGAGDDEQARRFVSEFDSRPIKFIVSSYRLRQFPDRIGEFWRQRYVRYGAAVWIPGRRLRGQDGTHSEFTAVVEGSYRWLLPEGHPPVAVIVDGRTVEPGDSIHLARGRHQLELAVPVKGGVFAYAVADERPAPAESFYSLAMRGEYAGWPWAP